MREGLERKFGKTESDPVFNLLSDSASKYHEVMMDQVGKHMVTEVEEWLAQISV